MIPAKPPTNSVLTSLQDPSSCRPVGSPTLQMPRPTTRLDGGNVHNAGAQGGGGPGLCTVCLMYMAGCFFDPPSMAAPAQPLVCRPCITGEHHTGRKKRNNPRRMITTHTRRMLECSTCHVLQDAKTGFTKNERKQYDCAETPPPVATTTTTGGQQWTPPPPPVDAVGRRKTITCRTCRRIHGHRYVPPPANAMLIPLYAPKPPVGGAYHYFNGEYYLETGTPSPKQQYPSHHPGHTNYHYHHQQHHPVSSSGNNNGWNNSTGYNPQNHHNTQNNTFATTTTTTKTMPNQVGGSDGGGGGWNAATIKLRQHPA